MRKAPTPAPAPGFCEQCGAPLEAEAAFCAACGSRIAPPAAAAPQPQPATPPQPQPATAPQPQPAAPQPATPRARGAWARRARVALAALVALAVVAGVGLWPLLSARIPALQPKTGGSVSASGWLTEGPSDPVVFTRSPVWATPDAMKATPDAYQQRIVLLSGTPVAVGAENGLGLAAFEAGGARVVVGYPGGRTAFAKGTAVTVAGVLAPTGDEVLALAVSPGIPGDRGRNRDLALFTLAAAGAFALSAVFVRVRRGRSRRRLLAAALVPALATSLLLGGCDIVIHTTVSRDGSGSVSTRVVTGEESMDELMGLPNAQAFIDSWTTSQEREGVKVERTTNQLKLDRTFATLEDFGALSGDTGTSWSRLGAVDLPDGRHVFFVASIDTASVYPDAPEEGADTTAYDKLKEEIDASTLRYELDLPGTVVGTNADGKGAWDIAMGGRRFLFAESLTGASDADSRLVSAQRIWAETVRWLFALAAGLLAFGLIAYPWRTKGGEVRG